MRNLFGVFRKRFQKGIGLGGVRNGLQEGPLDRQKDAFRPLRNSGRTPREYQGGVLLFWLS